MVQVLAPGLVDPEYSRSGRNSESLRKDWRERRFSLGERWLFAWVWRVFSVVRLHQAAGFLARQQPLECGARGGFGLAATTALSPPLLGDHRLQLYLQLLKSRHKPQWGEIIDMLRHKS